MQIRHKTYTTTSLRTKSEMLSFTRSKDMMGPEIQKAGLVALTTPVWGGVVCNTKANN